MGDFPQRIEIVWIFAAPTFSHETGGGRFAFKEDAMRMSKLSISLDEVPAFNSDGQGGSSRRCPRRLSENPGQPLSLCARWEDLRRAFLVLRADAVSILSRDQGLGRNRLHVRWRLMEGVMTIKLDKQRLREGRARIRPPAPTSGGPR